MNKKAYQQPETSSFYPSMLLMQIGSINTSGGEGGDDVVINNGGEDDSDEEDIENRIKERDVVWGNLW